jgi:TatD DNase family protein
MLKLIDIGLNLTHDAYDEDRDSVLAEAAVAGVDRMIVTGTSVTASVKARELCAHWPDRLHSTAGIHPHHAAELDAHGGEALLKLLGDDYVVAVGECGLDYFRNFSPKADQIKAFEAQLELARATGLPVFLHQRDAHEDMIRILGKHRAGLNGGVAHCFTGGVEELKAYLDLDFYVGVTGWICDERRGEGLRQAVAAIPLERLLLETDAPYLLPRDLDPKPKSRRNEPKYLPHIATRVAALTGIALDTLADATTANAERLFGLEPKRGQTGQTPFSRDDRDPVRAP